MSIELIVKAEEEVKSAVVSKIKEELEKYKNEYPKDYEKNFERISQLESITPEHIEIFAPQEVVRPTELEFDLDRYYRYTYRDGSVGNIYKNEPVRLHTRIFKAIYIINGLDAQYRKCVNYTSTFDFQYVFFDNKITNSSFLDSFKTLYEFQYRNDNATRLFNVPEETTSINCSNWRILDKSVIIDIPTAAIILNITPELKMQIGKYTKSELKIELDSFSTILKESAYDKDGNYHVPKIQEDASEGKLSFIGKIWEGILSILEFLLDCCS